MRKSGVYYRYHLFTSSPCLPQMNTEEGHLYGVYIRWHGIESNFDPFFCAIEFWRQQKSSVLTKTELFIFTAPAGFEPATS